MLFFSWFILIFYSFYPVCPVLISQYDRCMYVYVFFFNNVWFMWMATATVRFPSWINRVIYLLNHYLRNTCFQIYNKCYTIIQDDYAFMKRYLWNTHVQHCNNGPQGALTINMCLITVKGCFFVFSVVLWRGQTWLRWRLELPPLSLPASHTCIPSYHYP